MYAAITSCWALLLGMGFMMLGHGLQGSLLGLRATLEGFPTAITGLIMSAYFVGFLAGSTFTPQVVKRVGHIRVFAAFASLASSAVLIYVVFIDPITWAILRLVTGFCYAGLYVVAESWLNDRSTNETRGQLLSVYMVVMLGGAGAGQFLLNVAAPTGFGLFILVSVLVSVALIPIALTNIAAPKYDAPERVGLRDLYRITPLGVLASLGTGAAHGAFFGMGAVYAEKLGLSVAEISIFMGVYIFGGMIFQWPIGRLSDRLDRRYVLIGVTILAALAALAAIQAPAGDGIAFYALTALFGGMSLPMYSLCLAYTNDYLEPRQMVAASGGLVFTVGLGAILGPLIVSASMAAVGDEGFFWSVATVHAAIGLFALYRMTRRPTRPVEHQLPYVEVMPNATAVAAAVVSQSAHEHQQREQTGSGTVGSAAPSWRPE